MKETPFFFSYCTHVFSQFLTKNVLQCGSLHHTRKQAELQ